MPAWHWCLQGAPPPSLLPSLSVPARSAPALGRQAGTSEPARQAGSALQPLPLFLHLQLIQAWELHRFHKMAGSVAERDAVVSGTFPESLGGGSGRVEGEGLEALGLAIPPTCQGSAPQGGQWWGSCHQEYLFPSVEASRLLLQPYRGAGYRERWVVQVKETGVDTEISARTPQSQAAILSMLS